MNPKVAYGFFCSYVHPSQDGTITAVGVFGDECRIPAAPPVRVDLAVHFYVRQTGPSVLRGHIEWSLPGMPGPTLVPVAIPIAESQHAAHVNLNAAASPLIQDGEAVARLVLEAEPPVEHELRVRVRFLPPAQSS